MTNATTTRATETDTIRSELKAIGLTALDQSSVAREKFCQLARILGADPVIDGGPDGIPDVGVIDPTTGDVLGAGASVSEALDEALATARGWTP